MIRRRVPVGEIAAIVRKWPTAQGYGPFIAEKFDVPLPTARRWVAETRRRGLLPSGLADRPCPHCGGTGVVQWGSGDKTTGHVSGAETYGEIDT